MSAKADREAREILRHTSTLCLRKLHDQCVAEICECDCHDRIKPPVGGTPKDKPLNFDRLSRKEPAVAADPPPMSPRADGIRLTRSEPPPKRSRTGVLAAVLALVDDMRAEPGVWFQVGTFPGKSTAGSTRKRLAQQAPDIQWESRMVGTGSGLWGRAPE